MNDCPICDFPLVWSETHERHWCSVYGWHRRERFHGPNVMRVGVHAGGCASTPDSHALHTRFTRPTPSSTRRAKGNVKAGGNHQ